MARRPTSAAPPHGRLSEQGEGAAPVRGREVVGLGACLRVRPLVHLAGLEAASTFVGGMGADEDVGPLQARSLHSTCLRRCVKRRTTAETQASGTMCCVMALEPDAEIGWEVGAADLGLGGQTRG